MKELTIVEKLASVPSGSTHPKHTFKHGPCYVQNLNSVVVTFTCDAPHVHETINTGSTEGELLNSISRKELRQRYVTVATGSDAALLLEDGTDTGYDVEYAVTAVGYIDAGTELAGTAVVTGTIDTAVTKTATFSVTDTSDDDKTPRDNGHEAYTLEYVTSSDALTSVTIKNTMRDFIATDKIVFDIEGQGGQVSVAIPVVSGDLTSHNEISTLYVNTNGTETNKYRQDQKCKVSITTGTGNDERTNTYDFHLFDVVTAEVSGVTLDAYERTPFAVSSIQHASNSNTRNFLLLK